jgi:hypothetical protein
MPVSTGSSKAAFMACARKGRPRSPEALPQRTRVFDRGALAVHLLETREAAALLVREHDLEAVPARVAEGELRPGVGALAAAERLGALRPGWELERQLGHPGALALAARAVEGREALAGND